MMTAPLVGALLAAIIYCFATFWIFSWILFGNEEHSVVDRVIRHVASDLTISLASLTLMALTRIVCCLLFLLRVFSSFRCFEVLRRGTFWRFLLNENIQFAALLGFVSPIAGDSIPVFILLLLSQFPSFLLYVPIAISCCRDFAFWIASRIRIWIEQVGAPVTDLGSFDLKRTPSSSGTGHASIVPPASSIESLDPISDGFVSHLGLHAPESKSISDQVASCGSEPSRLDLMLSLLDLIDEVFGETFVPRGDDDLHKFASRVRNFVNKKQKGFVEPERKIWTRFNLREIWEEKVFKVLPASGTPEYQDLWDQVSRIQSHKQKQSRLERIVAVLEDIEQLYRTRFLARNHTNLESLVQSLSDFCEEKLRETSSTEPKKHSVKLSIRCCFLVKSCSGMERGEAQDLLKSIQQMESSVL
jgi:hypothetical protein